MQAGLHAKNRRVPIQNIFLIVAFIVSALWGTDAFAQTPAAFAAGLGRKLDLAKRADGTPDFRLHYSFGKRKSAEFSLSLQARQLISSAWGSVTPSFWILVNKETMTAVTSWQSTSIDGQNFSANSIVPMAFQVDRADAAVVPFYLSKAVLVFSLNTAGKPIPTGYLDLSEICHSRPALFLDIDTLRTGCP